jgi:hypothetical protein
MDQLLAHAVSMPAVFDELANETYTKTELQIIRKGSLYTEDILKKMMKNITLLAASIFRDHPRVTKRPPLEEVLDTFIFRSALCGNLLALRWISVGGAKNILPERMRNDLVDMFVAAYATYFDGLLTADKKLNKLYQEAVVLLHALSTANPAVGIGSRCQP